jgi:superfamily II DNA or RNA helicase
MPERDFVSTVRGEWAYSIDHDEPCRVIAVDALWGEQTARVWLARSDRAVRVGLDRLRRLGGGTAPTIDQLCYVSAAARVVDALGRDELTAPLEGSVVPLPHQVHALQRAMAEDTVRYLLADEVGLGKTIEAGLILRELKVRGLVRRTLVVAPTGLTSQWVAEMKTHFGEEFHLVQPGNFSTWRQLASVDEAENLWRLHDQVVCPLDSIKPLDGRRGWSAEQLARFNRERFEDVVAAAWDLVIIDEAHRLGGSSEQVARHRLGEALAQATPYLLLLSATPHQGKTDAFRRLVGFLDADALPDDESVTRENVAPYVIRTEKRHAIDAEGHPLFKPRRTQVVPVAWDETRPEQHALYDAVTEYVREGYDRAMAEKRTAIGFLMILMQRLVTSSTAAIRVALERRLEILELPSGQLSLFGEDVGDDWVDMDGQAQMDALLGSRLKGLANERAEVELLLSAARRCEARAPDGKAEALLGWIQALQREENDPALKVLVFTEFIPTQRMLAEFLRQRGFEVACLNGAMDIEARRHAQREFAGPARVLISTDAGGEGLNLQFCHVVVNYDLPWNPMKLEQRIGRVDRIGQKHVVRALNFAMEGTVELRVREVLEEKLQRILEEFGVDKLSDVLDSEEGDADFERLYVRAVLSPEQAESQAEALAEALRARARAARDGAKVLSATARLDPASARRLAAHQMPFWTEQMTVAWLRSHSADGAGVEAREHARYDLVWPDGHRVSDVTFSRDVADRSGISLLTLEDRHVRELTRRVAPYVQGMPIPAIVVPGVSDKVNGVWSLWRIAIESASGRMERMLPVFVSENGQTLGPTARAVWDRLIAVGEGLVRVDHALSPDAARDAYDRSRLVVEEQGLSVFRELSALHDTRINRERRKMETAFAARRRAIERLGLDSVRASRLVQLERELAEWRADIERRSHALPDLSPLLLVVVAADHRGQ